MKVITPEMGLLNLYPSKTPYQQYIIESNNNNSDFISQLSSGSYWVNVNNNFVRTPYFLI